MDNLLVSPHCAGVNWESSIKTATIAAQNILGGLDGELDPAFVVNPEVL
jgi:phosphoglycerate dehydrogenase-like enzyme